MFEKIDERAHAAEDSSGHPVENPTGIRFTRWRKVFMKKEREGGARGGGRGAADLEFERVGDHTSRSVLKSLHFP